MCYKMPTIYSVSLLDKKEQTYRLTNVNDDTDEKTIKLNIGYLNHVNHLIQLIGKKECYYEYKFNIVHKDVLGEPLFLCPLESDVKIDWNKSTPTKLQQLYNVDDIIEE